MTSINHHLSTNLANPDCSTHFIMPEAASELPSITKVASRLKINDVLPRHSPTLEDCDVLHQNDPATFTNEVVKTKSVGLGFFSWTAIKIFKSIRFCVLLGAPSSVTKDKTDEKLNELTGSIHSAKTLHALVPGLSSLIQRKLTSLEGQESLNEFFKGEHHSIQTCIDVLLPTLYKNLAQKIRNGQELTADKIRPVAFVDVISFICQTIDANISQIKQQIENIEKKRDGEEKDKMICQVFSPMADDFLALAFPNGLDELPLIKIPLLSQRYWTSLQKEALPSLFYYLYRQLTIPARENKKDLLLQMQGGESLVSLAQMAAGQATELLPSLFLDTIPENSEGCPPEIHETSLVAKMAKGFCTLLDGSDLLKTWIGNWFTKELAAFSESENIYLKKLWKLLGGYLEPLLIHVFVSMADVKASLESNKGRIPDAIGIIVIRLLTISSRFHHENHKRIEDRLSQLIKTGENYKEDSCLLKIFEPFADELFCLMGLDDPSKLPLPDLFKGLVTGPLKASAPAFLLRQYVAILNMDVDDQSTHRKLRTLLFDPKNLEDPDIAIKILAALHKDNELSGLNMFNEFYRNLWDESKTERIAKTLEAMSTALATEVVDSTMQYYGISAQALLKEDNSPLMAKLNKGLISFVDRNILNTLVHIMSTIEEKEPPAKGKHPKFLAAVNIMIHLVSIVNKHMDELKQMHEKNGQGLAADLHALVGTNPFQDLPLNELPGTKSVKKGLWTGVKNAILPQIVHQAFLDTIKWQINLQNSYAELDHCYHTSHPRWTCKVIGQYSTDFIRHYLQNNGDAAKLILSSVKGRFSAFKDVTHACDDLKTEMESFIQENLQKFVDTDDRECNALWPALTVYTEAAVAKFLSGISKTIREIELENPDLTVDIAIQTLKDTARHFSTVARATQEAGVDQSFEVPLEAMIAAFGKNLHDGVPLDPSDPSDVKDKVRLQGFFIPLTTKLFKLANLSVQDFPLPTILRQPLGELMVHKVLPIALMCSFQKFLEPQARNTLMLNLMQMLYAAFNGHELAKREGGLKEAVGYPDPKQKHLYETCGFVVLELIKLIPDTAVQYVFMKEKVKNMSAQAIGDALMPYLSRWTLLQMLDKVIYLSLPNLHQAKWEGKLGREDLIPLKAFVRPDGNMELKRVKHFAFNFPSTEREIKVLNEAKVKEAAEIRMELRNALTKTISQQLHLKAWAFVKSLWVSLQDHLNDLVERMFSQNGLAVKNLLDKIFRRVFFDVAGTVIQFLFTPVVSFIKFFTEKTVIDRRSEDIIENMQSELLENLFYKWTDTVVDALIRLKTVKQSGYPDSGMIIQ